MRTTVHVALAIAGVLGMATYAHAGTVLFAGADTEEFSGSTTDRIAKGDVSGAAITATTVLTVGYHVNGLAVLDNNLLLTGTVGSSATTATEGQTLRTVDFNGASIATYLNSGRPSTQFNEDMGYFGGYVYAAHYNSNSSGNIYKIDPNNLTSSVASYSLGFGVVGMAVVGTDIWITDWANSSVGIWNEGLNTYTHKFYTTQGGNSGGTAGALAWDGDTSTLWVGQGGGFVQAFDLNGNVKNGGAKWFPFGTGFSATVDGLDIYSPNAAPPVVPLPSSALMGLALLAGLGGLSWRKRRNAVAPVL